MSEQRTNYTVQAATALHKIPDDRPIPDPPTDAEIAATLSRIEQDSRRPLKTFCERVDLPLPFGDATPPRHCPDLEEALANMEGNVAETTRRIGIAQQDLTLVQDRLAELERRREELQRQAGILARLLGKETAQ